LQVPAKIDLMKKILFIPAVLLLFAFIQQETIRKEHLMDTKELAEKLTDAKAVKPVIYNVGPVDQIKTAINTGAVSTDAGFKKFRFEVSKITKDKEVVVYCGCCTASNCPNIRPAHKYLLDQGFKKAKILDIPTGIKEDWVQKDYPMEEKD
jgi:thiosulfate/3-mercaptopyruvate sulfurtransferase